MTAAFDRVYQLTIARSDPKKYFAQQPNALRVSKLELKFEIERSLESTPNVSKISVFNLSSDARAEFTKRPIHVKLATGYANDSQLATLSEGDCLFASSKRDGQGNIITTFQLGDGQRAYSLGRVSASFGAGVNVRDAVSSVAASMGLTVPTSASGAGAFLKQFSNGLTLHGPSRNAMDKLVAGSGFAWSIQNGQLTMLTDRDTVAGQAELVSPETGLIESPDYALPTKPGDPAVLKFKVLLRPNMSPGRLVKMESADIRGAFRVKKVKHTGDYRDNEWFSEVEANPI